MRVTDNIYVLSGSYYSAVNDSDFLGEVYGVYTPEGLILIDCGIPVRGLEIIRENLAYYGITDKITHLIITHAHWDHCGCAAAIQAMGAKVIVGAEDKIYCTNGGVRGLDPRSPFDDTHVFDALTPDILIEKDCEMLLGGLAFAFIKTPGHTPGSIMIKVNIDGKTAVFTGDALQPDGKSIVSEVEFGWQGDIGFCRENIVKSMVKLMDHETDMVLPGHGKICLRNGTQVLRLAAQNAFLTLR
ncbi:MAG: MBL fold metallo-hydrolase [Oscillospiraceae bacterium]|nr:MBL fold metallo-hydrolase [Oscillospiraceae bacterium]